MNKGPACRSPSIPWDRSPTCTKALHPKVRARVKKYFYRKVSSGAEMGLTNTFVNIVHGIGAQGESIITQIIFHIHVKTFTHRTLLLQLRQQFKNKICLSSILIVHRTAKISDGIEAGGNAHIHARVCERIFFYFILQLIKREQSRNIKLDKNTFNIIPPDQLQQGR